MNLISTEEIDKRQSELAEIKHAESVYRDIVEREKERKDYEKRWFWELLQNAKDAVDINQKVKVKVDIRDNEISFSHNGNPFDLDDILTLILQGSTKISQDNKTGRFGTGFISTYLLSKEVEIAGQIIKDGKSGFFKFTLNRNASNPEEFYELQKRSSEEFKNSIVERSYLDDQAYQTKFTYRLDDNGKITAKAGTQNLIELLSITLLFNDQIDEITIIENSTRKTFIKSLIEENKDLSIEKWLISVQSDSVISPIFNIQACLHKTNEYEACILIDETNNKVLHLSNNYPKFYFSFPLIGTEEIGIPIIINSRSFDPRKERNGIYLNDNEANENVSTNKEIVKDALLNSITAFADYIQEIKIKGGIELFNFYLSKDFSWIDQHWFNNVKKQTIDALKSKKFLGYQNSVNEFSSFAEIKIPFSEKEETTIALWHLLNDLNNFQIPPLEELNLWLQIAKNIKELEPTTKDIFELEFVWGIDKLIKFVEGFTKIDELKTNTKSDVYDWLNKLYSLILDIKNYFPLEFKICLNQLSTFRKAEGMFWDNCNDDDLISISDSIGLTYSNLLFSKYITKIQISGIRELNKQNALNSIKEKLNSFSVDEIISDQLKTSNARFLKWLIKNKEINIIKDIKVISGADTSSEEKILYDKFPSGKHLLLAPKAKISKAFPLYSTLTRDIDCLNDIYVDFLNDNDFEYLNDNNFLHSSPLIIKEVPITSELLQDLIYDENDLNILLDEQENLISKFNVKISDFAYLTTSDNHIYARNQSQKSSLERLKFFLLEAVEKDPLFDIDHQEIEIEGVDKKIALKQCRWVYRAKALNWVKTKPSNEKTESKLISETPSSKNIAELIKNEKDLINIIKGEKQKIFLKKIGVGVSELIRNTLPDDNARAAWDDVMSSLITSDVDPKLVLEIFNNPEITNEYQKKLKEKEILQRNQSIGDLIEKLFEKYINNLIERGVSITIQRKPFGSDYLLTDESSDLVNNNQEREVFEINHWLVELKATGKEFAAMTPLQATTASENKDNYALVVIPLDGTTPDLEYLENNARVIFNIGFKVNSLVEQYIDIENKKNNLSQWENGISLFIEEKEVRFKVNASIWEKEGITINAFLEKFFFNT